MTPRQAAVRLKRAAPLHVCVWGTVNSRGYGDIKGVIGLLQGLLVKWDTRSSVHPSPQRMKPLQRLKSINSRQQSNSAVQHLRVERANRNQNHNRS